MTPFVFILVAMLLLLIDIITILFALMPGSTVKKKVDRARSRSHSRIAEGSLVLMLLCMMLLIAGNSILTFKPRIKHLSTISPPMRSFADS